MLVTHHHCCLLLDAELHPDFAVTLGATTRRWVKKVRFSGWREAGQRDDHREEGSYCPGEAQHRTQGLHCVLHGSFR
jgi:hypothetical protein